MAGQGSSDMTAVSDAKVTAANSSAEEVHAAKEKKLQRLQQMTSLKTNQSSQNEEIQNSNKKKVEFAKTVDMNRKMIETIFEQLQQINMRCDTFDAKIRDIDFRMEDAKTKAEDNKTSARSELKAEIDKVNGKLQQENEQRLQGVQELEKIIGLRDKKLSQSISNEVNEEANARMLVANDCTRLSDHLKEVKIGLTEDISRLQAHLANMQSKNHQEFADVKELVSVEKATRERAMISCKNDFQLRQVEIKQALEARCQDVLREQKAGYSQLTVLLEQLRADNHKQMCSANLNMESLDAKQNQRMDNIDATVMKSCNEIMHTMEMMGKTIHNSLTDLDQKQTVETEKRMSDFCKVREDMAEEHLRREQDESAIISMMETFMTQAREMNAVYTTKCV